MLPQVPLRRLKARLRPVRRTRAALLLTPLTLMLAIALVPEVRLACAEPEAGETSPDGA